MSAADLSAEGQLPEHLRSATCITIATGLRRAGVRGPRWSQIDVARQVVTVVASDIQCRKTLGTPRNASVNTAWRNALKKSGIEDFRLVERQAHLAP